MDPARWNRIEEIGARAAELEGAEREAFLTEACEGDDGLRGDIEALLEQIRVEGSFLDHPLVTPERDRGVGPSLPETIGDFRVVGVLGEGGMGTVYEAVREGDGFTQRVALKLIQSRFTSEELRRRFLTERRILASLEHPGIARFIEGGSTPAGRSYVAMEYVEGLPILEHCRASGLGLEERLDLFVQVCEAVQHAHEKLVVHRDLKPSNILVADSGRPKLLDFGIGKLLEAEGELDATRTGQLLLTPRFAAPEQLRGEAVTTATDVYSLGILLYQLLTGVHPYATPGSSLVELQEAVLTREVMRPSDRLARSEKEEGGPGLAGAGSGGRSAWRRRLRGDLDSITLKALRKEPPRRYPTAAALKEDVARWRNGMPVRARPDSAAYRFRRFVGRHRLLVAVATLAFLAVSTSAVAAGVQYRRAQQEAEQARFERDRAEGVVSFMTGLFEWADPNRARGAEITAGELLAAGTERVDSAFAAEPELQSALYGTIAPIYTRIGLHGEAEAVARRALATGDDPGDPETRTSQWVDLGRALHGQTRYDEAEEAFATAVGMSEQPGVEPLTRARALALLGAFYAERNVELETAEEVLRASIDLYRSEGEQMSDGATVPLQSLAMILGRQDRGEEAMGLFDEALGIMEREVGREHTRVASILSSMASLAFRLEDYEASVQHLEEVLDIRRVLYDEGHAAIGTSWYNLGQAYYGAGRPEDGRTAYENALAIRVPALGEGHVQTANTHFNYGFYLARSEESWANAAEQMEAAVAGFRAVGGESHRSLGTAILELGAYWIQLERFEEAEALLLDRYRWTESRGGDLESLKEWLVRLYEAWGMPDRAEPWRTPPG